MNLEQATKLTDEEKNHAIAMATGWKKGREICKDEWIWQNPDGRTRGQICIPNYLSDLNSMHHAEKTMSFSQCQKYHEILASLQAYSNDENDENDTLIPAENFWFHATPEQRATAFIASIP